MQLTREQRRIPEGSSATFKSQFLDADKIPISRATVTALKLTLKDIRTEAVINGRNDQSVLSSNGGDMPANLVVSAVTLTGSVVRVQFTVNHRLETGMLLYLSGIVGATELNGTVHRIVKDTDDTVILDQVDAASVSAYVSGGDGRTGLMVMDFDADDNPIVGLALSGATQANPVVLTFTTAHELPDGSDIRVEGITGQVELNGRRFRTRSAGWNSVELIDEDGTGHTAYVSGGTVTPLIGQIEPHQAKFVLTYSGKTVPNPVQLDVEQTL